MAGFLIFYWIFSTLFTVGVVCSEHEHFKKADILLLILMSPYMLPAALGLCISLSAKYLEQLAKHKKK
jgi:hypothetical protein